MELVNFILMNMELSDFLLLLLLLSEKPRSLDFRKIFRDATEFTELGIMRSPDITATGGEETKILGLWKIFGEVADFNELDIIGLSDTAAIVF